MNTSEDTKCGVSVVADTLRSLSEQARICHERIDQLEAGRPFIRAEVLAEVGKLIDVCQNLRDAILSEDGSAKWSTKDELQSVVHRLEETASKRRRYLDLAELLASGTIVHRRERTRQERLSLRDKAVAELMEISDRSAPPELPGPETDKWLDWACSLEDDRHEAELSLLKSGFPRLDDFVRQLEIDWWRDGSPDLSAEPVKAIVLPIAKPKVESSNGNGIHKQADHQEIVETPKLQAVEQADPEPVQAVADPVHEPALAEPVAVIAPEQADEEERELPADMLTPSKKGKVSFFSWDQIEQFTRRIDKAKVEKKDTRKIRALLAISHWIEPQDHNPATHPKCSIRTLTGYAGTSDLVLSVSPSDVMRIIDADEGLPLLIGGADLLRWGLLQPSERNFQGIASVRRFTVEHLKAWFSEIHRIALSEKQIEDIFNLTSGIPLLVGELHKLIIPAPDDPPTWLGLARWIEIKAQFEKELPQIAHELTKGVPAVRLTDRELSLLNMIVIASADSTRETIVANLSENWEHYQHPEYRPLSSRDEASLALLMDLGLLPMRNVTGVVPSKALLPVKKDDAIHRIVEHL